jgi:hypothetical protein
METSPDEGFAANGGYTSVSIRLTLSLGCEAPKWERRGFVYLLGHMIFDRVTA